jgi:hypothetical protein
MHASVLEFTAPGSPEVVSRAIEQFAANGRGLSAIVVPWESGRERLSMSLTSMRGEGWAVEHTNLGTITLTSLGNDETRVAVLADETEGVDQERVASVVDAFARHIQGKLQASR